jgi:hypothetical protein
MRSPPPAGLYLGGAHSLSKEIVLLHGPATQGKLTASELRFIGVIKPWRAAANFARKRLRQISKMFQKLQIVRKPPKSCVILTHFAWISSRPAFPNRCKKTKAAVAHAGTAAAKVFFEIFVDTPIDFIRVREP